MAARLPRPGCRRGRARRPHRRGGARGARPRRPSPARCPRTLVVVAVVRGRRRHCCGRADGAARGPTPGRAGVGADSVPGRGRPRAASPAGAHRPGDSPLAAGVDDEQSSPRPRAGGGTPTRRPAQAGSPRDGRAPPRVRPRCRRRLAPGGRVEDLPRRRRRGNVRLDARAVGPAAGRGPPGRAARVARGATDPRAGGDPRRPDPRRPAGRTPGRRVAVGRAPRHGRRAGRAARLWGRRRAASDGGSRAAGRRSRPRPSRAVPARRESRPGRRAPRPARRPRRRGPSNERAGPRCFPAGAGAARRTPTGVPRLRRLRPRRAGTRRRALRRPADRAGARRRSRARDGVRGRGIGRARRCRRSGCCAGSRSTWRWAPSAAGTAAGRSARGSSSASSRTSPAEGFTDAPGSRRRAPASTRAHRTPTSSRSSSSGGPLSTTRPPAITTTRSALRASDIEWVTTSVVRPCMRENTPSRTRCSVSASSPVVGSSSTRIGGSRSSTRAMPRRWRWPPDRPAPPGSSGVSRPWGRPATNSPAPASSTHSLIRHAGASRP